MIRCVCKVGLEMLGFAARHGVKARVQVMPMAQCNEAMAITRSGSARYRMVLANETDSDN